MMARLSPAEVRMLAQQGVRLINPAGSPGAAYVRRMENVIAMMKGNGE